MTLTEKRDQMRKVFYEAWQKYRENLPLDPLESMMIEIILSHPEYQPIFDHPLDHPADHANPFLHIGLHLAIREQIGADRPTGIRSLYHALCLKFQDAHVAEHRMLDVLEQILWDAQQTGSLPDEQYYLDMLRKIE